MTPSTEAPISLTRAMWRGFKMRCPKCGEGRLFRSPLRVVELCAVCGEDYTHQRADDFPAYLVIIVVGHIIVPIILGVETEYAPPVWLQLAIYLPVTLILALALIQPTKGAIVALQWHTGMHGFEAAKRAREERAAQPNTGLKECAS
jgi:uncharacterized protein (DUF983 family)